MDTLQAAILDVKLKHLDTWINHRANVAETYMHGLVYANKIVLPVKKEWAKHAYHLFVIRHPQRDYLIKLLSKKGIQTGIHYPIPLPNLKAYRDINNNLYKHSFSSNYLLSLPIGEHMSQKDQDHVVNVMIELCD